MKQPKMSDLKIDTIETNSIRAKIKKQSSVKITINIDTEALTKIRSLSDQSGVPYQRLLNNILKENLNKKETDASRLDRLEKELILIKTSLAA